MADELHTKNINKLYQICCQFLGKENYNKENYKHKIEKIYFMNIATYVFVWESKYSKKGLLAKECFK